ncbi:hypothetical protein Agub_g11501 [Astrephomene gubernaculifera]|uniref:protein-serine/threonine phosphatase n=1 Tax=Astrephomene gubernaculifera TaxID=47775 RepID=A0AAD3HQI8_9CHLO|nr:hypothetical protein Agub_g11501 [Astrephomene gubernaculifera]
MLGLWPAAFCPYVDDLDDDADHVPTAPGQPKGEVDDRGRKRQRRSIFFAGPDSDSDDGEDDLNLQAAAALNRLRPDSVHGHMAVVPSSPYAANPLSKGTCVLTPSFPRRSSSPCLSSTSSFVAVHEEPNASFRSYMEDRSAAMTADGVAYLGIYDGHGGIDASTFLQRHLLSAIQAHLQPGCDVHDALTTAYSTTNAAFRATGSIQGSTATTVIIKQKHLIAANVGDSPAFVVKKSGEVYSVIQEHKIEGDEAARIAAQGAPIYRSPTGPAYMGTPDGTRWLNMSRAFGDFVYPAISCEPHVCSLDVSDGKYLVMGSDGLTEKWPVAEAAQYLTQLASRGWSLPAICRSMVEQSLARGSTDNISCMVIDLEAYMLHVTAAEFVEGGAPEHDEKAAGSEAADAAAKRQRTGGDTDDQAIGTPVQECDGSPQELQRTTPVDEDRNDRWVWLQEDAADAGEANEEARQFVCAETPADDQQQERQGSPGCRHRCLQPRGTLASALALATCAAAALDAECSASGAVQSACDVQDQEPQGGVSLSVTVAPDSTDEVVAASPVASSPSHCTTTGCGTGCECIDGADVAEGVCSASRDSAEVEVAEPAAPPEAEAGGDLPLVDEGDAAAVNGDVGMLLHS